MTPSPVDSPVGRVVGQVLPGRELAPGTHIQSGGFRDLRYAAVPRFTAIGEPIALRRLGAVISRGRHSGGLKHRYNVSQSSGIVVKNLKKKFEIYIQPASFHTRKGSDFTEASSQR